MSSGMKHIKNVHWSLGYGSYKFNQSIYWEFLQCLEIPLKRNAAYLCTKQILAQYPGLKEVLDKWVILQLQNFNSLQVCQEGNKNICNEQFYCSTKINFICNKYSTNFWWCVKCTLQFWRTITCRQPFCLQTGITAYEVTYCKITKHPIHTHLW